MTSGNVYAEKNDNIDGEIWLEVIFPFIPQSLCLLMLMEQIVRNWSIRLRSVTG